MAVVMKQGDSEQCLSQGSSHHETRASVGQYRLVHMKENNYFKTLCPTSGELPWSKNKTTKNLKVMGYFSLGSQTSYFSHYVFHIIPII